MSSLSSSEQATKSKGREILLVLPISIIGRGQGHLVVAAGAFTPSFGEEERSRTQQFVTAVVAALSLFDLKEAARIDPLTQLSSREHTLATITNALNGKGMFCVAIMDLDFFKNINDTYGHQTGDDTLVAIGQRVMGAVRHDDLVGRLSGEEFVVVFPQAELALAKIISGRILSTIAGTVIATKKAPVQLTASLGLTERRVDDSLDSILTRADRALYTAKNEGRNRLVAA